MYYKDDETISEDRELQSWMNELSTDGTGPDGGHGKVPGLPASMDRAKDLELFLVRFLWINIKHAVTNYAAIPNFTPISPGKLYERMNSSEAPDVDKEFSPLDSMPDGNAAWGCTIFRGKLTNFRYNRIFDYFGKVQDSKFSKLVRKTHHTFHTCLQKKLEERNAERKKQNKLGYQVLEPKWLTNSVHI